MGTNYYLHREVCQCCKRGKEVLHIGKSSIGWCFSLNTHPFEGITSLEDWKHAWAQDGTLIVDEYRSEIPAAEMLRTIAERKSFHGGPLRRHTVDGRHCLSHGEGTYDIMCGEFS